jgi:chromate transport protein ChrA
MRGSNSTEIAIQIGYLYAGWLGLIVAGVGFILPAILITIGLGLRCVGSDPTSCKRHSSAMSLQVFLVLLSLRLEFFAFVYLCDCAKSFNSLFAPLDLNICIS